MIIENISSIIEISLSLVCLHLLNRKKLKMKLSVISLIGMNILLMELINTYQMPEALAMVVYFAIAVYNITEFDNTIKGVLVDMILLIVNMGIMQTVAMLLLIKILGVSVVNVEVALLCHIIVLLLMLIFEHFIGYAKIKNYILEKNWLNRAIIILCIVSFGFGVITIKSLRSVSDWFFVWVAFFCTIMFTTWYRWIKQKERAQEKEADLHVQKLYYDSYEMLIKEIREKQHDYKNHIQALQNENYLHTDVRISDETYQKYYQDLIYNDRYSGLLKCKNSVIAGFLYGKIGEAERECIHVDYVVEIFSEQYRVPLYLIVEMLGILMDNAIEAVKDRGIRKDILLEIKEDSNEIHISVKNEIQDMSITDFMKAFERNYSTKGAGRGLGLYKLRQYAKKYDWEIAVDFDEQEGHQYITINIGGQK